MQWKSWKVNIGYILVDYQKVEWNLLTISMSSTRKNFLFPCRPSDGTSMPPEHQCFPLKRVPPSDGGGKEFLSALSVVDAKWFLNSVSQFTFTAFARRRKGVRCEAQNWTIGRSFLSSDMYSEVVKLPHEWCRHLTGARGQPGVYFNDRDSHRPRTN